jgi:hypothetical protein
LAESIADLLISLCSAKRDDKSSEKQHSLLYAIERVRGIKENSVK